jgi:ribosomal protein RSM22 (predicted rRNA methylase)
VQAQILDDADFEMPLIVDVGAGKGHDLLALYSKFPDSAGKLVLQDLPPVIEVLEDLNPAIEKVAYDFFTDQPVKGRFIPFPFQIKTERRK